MDKNYFKLKFREKIFRLFFIVCDKYSVIALMISRLCRFLSAIALVFFILSFLYYIGFHYSPLTAAGLQKAFRITFIILFLSVYLPVLLKFRISKGVSLFFRSMLFLFTFGVLLSNFSKGNNEQFQFSLFYGNSFIIVAIFLIGISQLSELLKYISIIKIPPALILSISFLLIIFIGSGLLLLPKSNTGQLSYLDSLFTSVSAVCVTGLVVVDTATAFTTLGKIIILCLIQIGGLGIMTFTGLFGYIFTFSGSSLRDKLLLKEIFSSDSLSNLFHLLTKIILITFLTEIAGALLIYASLDIQTEKRVMFSIFHSVSAFCNAGFSTLSEGLFFSGIKSNYSVHLIIAFLIILGGIGFPVLVGVYSFIKYILLILIRKIQRNRLPVKSGKKNMPARIVLIMTLLLIFSGAGFYYLFESDTTLKGLEVTQKIVISFFGSVSSRTAGFNIVDITMWSYPTIFLMIALMWIGASPGSTGGGIKTTTFALALMSVWNNLRGREQLRIGNRELGSNTINRVLYIIFLSLVIITVGFFWLLLSEPEKNPVSLLFECVSAFATVGLSIAQTSTFGTPGKIIIMLLMFIGRVGPLTLFTGIMLSSLKRYSRYPELEIIIN